MSHTDAGPADGLQLRLTDPLILPLVPAHLRNHVTLLWSLDLRLAEIARTGREPALRQIKLRWWSDQLGQLGNAQMPAEPLLAAVKERLSPDLAASELAGLADAWVAEAIDQPDGRGERGRLLFAMTAALLGTEAPAAAAGGGLWALVDCGLNQTSDPAYWAAAASEAAKIDVRHMPRSLAALAALARRIALHDGARSRWREQAVVLRVGLIGR